MSVNYLLGTIVGQYVAMGIGAKVGCSFLGQHFWMPFLSQFNNLENLEAVLENLEADELLSPYLEFESLITTQYSQSLFEGHGLLNCAVCGVHFLNGRQFNYIHRNMYLEVNIVCLSKDSIRSWQVEQQKKSFFYLFLSNFQKNACIFRRSYISTLYLVFLSLCLSVSLLAESSSHYSFMLSFYA